MRPFETRVRGTTIVWDFGDATIAWDQASRRKLAPSRLHDLHRARWEPLDHSLAWSRIRMACPKIGKNLPRLGTPAVLAALASKHPTPDHVDLWFGLGGLELVALASARVFAGGRVRACLPLVPRLRLALADADDIDSLRPILGGGAYAAASITDEPTWTHEALQAFLDAGAKPAKLLPELGPYTRSPDLALEVVRATFRSPYSLAPRALDLVAHLGPDAVPALRLLLFERYSDLAMKPVVRALARIASDAAGQALIPMVTSAQLRATVCGWVRRNTSVALPILDAWIRETPEDALELGETHDLASHLAVLREDIAPAEPASPTWWPAGTPLSLRCPPWTRARPARQMIEVAPKQSTPSYLGRRTPGPQRAHAGVRDRVDRADAGETMSLHALLEGSDAEVMEIWSEGRPERYRGGPGDRRALLALVSRFGVASLAGLLLYADARLATSLDSLSRFVSPAVAPLMATAFAKTKSPVPERWMLAHPRAAALGLVPVALGEPRAPATEDAALALRFLGSVGQRHVVLRVAEQYGVDIEPTLSGDTPRRVPKPPAFLHLVRTPLRLRDGSVLPDAAVRTVATMLQLSRRVPHSGLDGVRAACDPRSTVALAKALFDTWHDQGATPEHDWVIAGLGHLGDDALIDDLLPFIDEWHGRGATRRVEKLLDAIAAMGTELALMHLDRTARRHPQRVVRDAASRSVTRVAARLGLSAEELEDRTAPTLGLDESRRTVLDLGTRSLEVVFDEALRPRLRDGQRVRVRFPSRRVRDVGYDEAKARFALLRERAKLVADQLVARLERMMTSERRVSVEDFERLFVRHPLVGHLVHRLVWRTDLGVELRVAEDGTYANEHDDEIEVAGAIGVAHPATMRALERWADIFGDYELVQPFAQIGRPTYRPRPDELEANRILRIENRTVAHETLVRHRLLDGDGPIRLEILPGGSGFGDCRILRAEVRPSLRELSRVEQSELYLRLEALY